MGRSIFTITLLGLFIFRGAAAAQDAQPVGPNLAVVMPVAPPEDPAGAPESDPAMPAPEAQTDPEIAPEPQVFGPPPVSVEIDLQEQRAYLLKDGRTVLSSPISSGRYGHLTPTGNFKITQKDLNHRSTLYGKIVDGAGRTVVGDASSSMRVPPGCRFVRAPMKYFMRFHGAEGMHAGNLPGYPASHGCVRMPASKAKQFFDAVELGTPVHVFGKAPARKPAPRIASRPVQERYQPAAQPVRRNFFERMFGRRPARR